MCTNCNVNIKWMLLEVVTCHSWAVQCLLSSCYSCADTPASYCCLWMVPDREAAINCTKVLYYFLSLSPSIVAKNSRSFPWDRHSLIQAIQVATEVKSRCCGGQCLRLMRFDDHWIRLNQFRTTGIWNSILHNCSY